MFTGQTKVRYQIIFLGFLASLINYADRIVISVAAPLILKEFQFSPVEWGFILSAFFWTYSPFAFIGGIMNDKFGARKTYSLCMFIWSIFVGLTGACWNFVSFMVVRLLFGIGEGPQPATTAKVVANWFPKSDSSKALSLGMLGVTVGPVLATPLVVWLMTQFGWRMSFFAMAAVGILWVICWHFMSAENPEDHKGVNQAELDYIRAADKSAAAAENEIADTGRGLWSYVKTGYVIGLSICYFAYSWVLFLVLTWYPTYLTRQHGVSISEMGFLATWPWVGATIGIIGGAWIADYFTKRSQGNDQISARKWIIVVCTLLTAVTFSVSAYVTNLQLSAVLITLAMTFLLASWQYQALIIAVMPKKLVGSMAGFIQFISTLAGILAPLTTGFLVQYTGSFNIAFYIGSALGVIGALMVAKYVKKDGIKQ